METCDLLSRFHVASCLGLGPAFVFEAPHTLSQPLLRVLSACVVIGNSFVSLTLLSFSVHPSCYKMFFKTNCVSSLGRS